MGNQHFHEKICKPAGPLTAQSGAAPGAGLLRLALLELNPAAVLARSGAITGNAIFRSYQLWLDYFMFFVWLSATHNQLKFQRNFAICWA